MIIDSELINRLRTTRSITIIGSTAQIEDVCISDLKIHAHECGLKEVLLSTGEFSPGCYILGGSNVLVRLAKKFHGSIEVQGCDGELPRIIGGPGFSLRFEDEMCENGEVVLSRVVYCVEG